MTGCGFGMDDLSTYLLKSGTGGHSVFNIYLLKSGHFGHGGIVLFNTYLLKSGSLHGGQAGQTGRGFGDGHLHGHTSPQLSHFISPRDSKPSFLFRILIPITIPIIKINIRCKSVTDIILYVSSDICYQKNYI
jgi:hypothetical protein